MEAVRLRQDEVARRIRAVSPRLADLQYPDPLGLEGVQTNLEPDTLLLYWSLGNERSWVIAVHREGVEAVPLETSVEAVNRQVGALRRRVSRPTAGAGSAVSGELSRLLLAALQATVDDSERLLLVPDGPLWLLPFAALQSAAGGGLLIEEKPLSLVASATVLAQLRAGREAGGGRPVVGFGDPRYPPEAAGAWRGLDLFPLPASRSEVGGLRDLYGDAARVLVGADATEEAVLALGPAPIVIHIAAHGLVDERFPLESMLALTIPARPEAEQENGLLQAWEVFEKLRIDADLVTLSACQTALGKEVAGEGIVGLTRAFQYAGARTVLASLWRVADESTAELMKRFYRGLRSGLPKDQALRQAQLAFIRGPVAIHSGDKAEDRDLSHPFYWAAFQLYGDWK
jgi:CHAT domain-containing protein